MNFLYPGFLFALLAIAIPILIHLFNFRKFKKVYFSNVQFLKAVKEQTSSVQRLKNLLILAARILAIVFLVFAFAQPYIPLNKRDDSHIETAVSIFVDNSYSMEMLNKEGSLFDEAKRKAKEIANAYPINTKFQLLSNDFEGKHQRLLGREEFLNAVDELKIGPLSKDLQTVVNRQQSVSALVSTIYIISDFQQNFTGKGLLKTDSTKNFRLVKVKAVAPANVAIDSVWFTSPVHKPGETEHLVIQLRNYADDKAENIPVKVTINGAQKALGSMSIAARSVKRDTLSFSKLGAGWQKAEVAITDHPVTFDDKFFFTFKVNDKVNVLAINGKHDGGYINALFGADNFFKLDNTPESNINYTGLGGYSLVILNGISGYSSGLTQQIKGYVQKGGSLVVFPTFESDIKEYNSFLQAMGLDDAESISGTPAKVNMINLQHPLFKDVFEQIPQNIDLPKANKYFVYSKHTRTSRQQLLELEGHRSFMAQYNLGEGTVYLTAVPLDESASNLPLHAVFVPLVYKMALTSMRTHPLYYVIGRDHVLQSDKLMMAPNQSLKLKKGNFEAIPDSRQTEGGTALFVADQVREPGIYGLMKGDAEVSAFAFNDNGKESDLSYTDDTALKNIFGKQPVAIYKDDDGIKNKIKAEGLGTQLWKLCLILALICLAVEIILIRYFNTKNKHTTHEPAD